MTFSSTTSLAIIFCFGLSLAFAELNRRTANAATEDSFVLAKGELGPEGGSRCWTNGNEQQARWLSHGERVDRGKFWYECADGKLRPVGCLDDQDNHVLLKQTFISGGYLQKCVLWAGLPRLNTVGCSPDGRKAYTVGERWEQQNEGKGGKRLWLECAWEGDKVLARQVGCVDKTAGRALALGERIDSAQSTFECRKSAEGVVDLVPVGCIAADGRRFSVGQQWQEEHFLFYCKRTGDDCQKACIGCVGNQGQNLFDGDRFRMDHSVFQCEVRPKRHALKPVACVAEDGVERVVDCKWQETASNGHRLQRQCVLRAGRALVDTLGCVFAKDGITRLSLRPGTFTLWRESMDQPPVGLACREGVAGAEPELNVFPAGEKEQWTADLKMDVDPRL